MRTTSEFECGTGSSAVKINYFPHRPMLHNLIEASQALHHPTSHMRKVIEAGFFGAG